MTHFNGLTPAEAERLAMLAEECGEVIQVIGKILRHGYESYHPADPLGLNNRGLLHSELTDLCAVLNAMDKASDVEIPLKVMSDGAWIKKLRYAHHQEESTP